MVQSFNRKDIVIYVRLRNYDLGDQSRTALEHLFTKYWRNSKAVQQILPRKRILASCQMTLLCLIETNSYGYIRKIVKYFVTVVKKKLCSFSIGWKNTLKFSQLEGHSHLWFPTRF